MIPLFLALAAAPKVHAIIVANNAPVDAGLAPLHYADDDGARYYELLSLIGRTELLSVLDDPSQLRFPEISRIAAPPTRAELKKRLARAFADIRAEEERGERTIFYFVFVGHGSVGADGQGAMHFLDGHFSKSDLFQQVIAASPASVNHVIIDACNAYLMVADRGDAKAIDEAVDGFLEKERLERHPNTGVLVSTSQAAEVHEWARFEAGVFSHEVRSALSGAADVNADGTVTYPEIRAFLAAANGRVQDPRAKLDVFVSPPPLHKNEPLFDRSQAMSAKTLHIPNELAGRYWLEDARGVRYADFHMSPDTSLTLTLVPSDVYFLRSGDEEIQIPFLLQTIADASSYTRQPASSNARGSEDLTFRRDLFAIPFGPDWYEGFSAAQTEASTEIAPEEGLSTKRITAIGIGAGGIATLATGVAFGISANAKAKAFNSSIDGSPDAANHFATAANVLYASGGALLTTRPMALARVTRF